MNFGRRGYIKRIENSRKRYRWREREEISGVSSIEARGIAASFPLHGFPPPPLLTENGDYPT